MRSVERRWLLGCGVWLIACSPEANFDAGTGTTSTSSSSSGSTSSSAGGGEGGGGGEVTAGGGDPGGGGPGGAGGATASASTGGGAPACVVADDCEVPAEPCLEATCGPDGVCGTTPRPAGTDGGACGVCQGGVHLGTCGYRLYSRVFPTAADVAWTAVPLSEVLGDVPNAPPPRGISEVETMHSVDRLFAWSDDGMLYEGGVDGWQPPVPIATRFPGFPAGARVALAVIWRPTTKSADESVLLTTDETPPRSISYTLSNGGTTIMATSEPTPIAPSGDSQGPPQDVTPWEWGFVEQRGYLGSSDDWVLIWGAMEGTLYQYWGGNDDYVSATPLTSPPVIMDGTNGAPDGARVAAAWRAGGALHVLAP